MTGLEQMRQDAARCFSELGFPTTRDEDWRFTNVAPIAKTQFQPAPQAAMGSIDGDLEQSLVPCGDALRLVFVNGRYSADLSTQRFPRGMRAMSLRETNGTVSRHLARYASFEHHAFVALNTASFGDGAYVEIANGTVVEEPISLLFVSTGGDRPVVSHPRGLIVMGPDSQATIVESYIGRGAQYFTNAVTEIVAGEHAVVDHYKVQLEDETSFHMATMQAQLSREVNFATRSLSFGGGLVRNDVNAVLSEGTQATVDGFYLVSGTQHVDNHTSIDHARPHGTSLELYKGILEGKSAAVFNGKIIVRPGAQKTDAKQTNKNLVLSEDATINSKPELKIHADDVRCTHGATIGQLDRDAIFYLQSRGIAQDQARDLLTCAFAREIIDRIRVRPLRTRLERTLSERLHAGLY